MAERSEEERRRANKVDIGPVFGMAELLEQWRKETTETTLVELYKERIQAEYAHEGALWEAYVQLDRLPDPKKITAVERAFFNEEMEKLPVHFHMDEAAEAWFRAQQRARQPATPPLAKLSDKETEIAHYIANGLTHGAVAKTLMISEHTVKTHCNNIAEKLNLKGKKKRYALALKEMGYGWG